MSIYETQKIASIARTLITELEFCDDEEFVELVLECVTTANPVPLEPEYL